MKLITFQSSFAHIKSLKIYAISKAQIYRCDGHTTICDLSSNSGIYRRLKEMDAFQSFPLEEA